jgi:hypothetical protein
LIFSAWRAATAIVTLRYLYFGLPDPDLSSPFVRSSATSPNAQTTDEALSYNVFDEFLHDVDDATTSFDPEEHTPSYTDSEHLSSEVYMSDPVSRTPSPLPPLHPTDANITLEHWHRRYEIHNNALSELVSSLSALSTIEDNSYLRYVLLPLTVLGLVSRPGSLERALYLGQMESFQRSMVQESTTTPSPIGGLVPEGHIPWDLLDAYSMEMEQQRRDSTGFGSIELDNAAPEWNWYYMLKRVNTISICKWTNGFLSLHPWSCIILACADTSL